MLARLSTKGNPPFTNSMNDIQALIPQHKFDTDRARAAIQAGYPAVAPILPQLLAWLQDYNWPVAPVLAPFLISIGKPLIPHIQNILLSQDETWKYWIISIIIRNSPELALSFRDDLERLALSPTDREVSEELDGVARQVLNEAGWNKTG
ncbi:MAG: DUF5071 domain-containing protein [Anaerolineales bacterium]